MKSIDQAGPLTYPSIRETRQATRGKRRAIDLAPLFPIVCLLFSGCSASVDLAEIRGSLSEPVKTDLMRAAETDNQRLLATLLAKGADVGASDYAGWEALHYAALKGSRQAVQALLDSGADIDSVTSEMLTPLHLSVGRGDQPLTQYLLGRGANPNIRDVNGATPLWYAAALDQTSSAQELSVAGGSLAVSPIRTIDESEKAAWVEEVRANICLRDNDHDCAKRHYEIAARLFRFAHQFYSSASAQAGLIFLDDGTVMTKNLVAARGSIVSDLTQPKAPAWLKSPVGYQTEWYAELGAAAFERVSRKATLLARIRSARGITDHGMGFGVGIDRAPYLQLYRRLLGVGNYSGPANWKTVLADIAKGAEENFKRCDTLARGGALQ